MTLDKLVTKIIEEGSPGDYYTIKTTPSRLRSCLENMGYDVNWVSGELNGIEYECTHPTLPKLFVDIWVEDFELILGVCR